MKTTLIFPTILILLDFGASMVYLLNGDIKHCIYWLAAMTLTICITL